MTFPELLIEEVREESREVGNLIYLVILSFITKSKSMS